MNDLFLQVGSNRWARRWLRRLGVPLPLPHPLERAMGPWEALPLDGQTVVSMVPFGRTAPKLSSAIAEHLVIAGAQVHVVGPELELYRDLGEAHGRPAHALALSAIPDRLRPNALVLDATVFSSVADLRALYDFFHALVPRLAPSGRVVVLGRPANSGASAQEAATCAALEGFVRSLAKEIGRRGATATLVVVHPGAEGRVGPVLRFILSKRSAFVTAQAIHVNATVQASPVTLEFVRPLAYKVALVTGAGRGIGKATARALADEGAHVVCVDRPADSALASALAGSIGGSALALDIADATAGDILNRFLVDRHGGADIIVHNAGVTQDKTLARMTAEQWDTAISVNLAAVTRIDDALLRGALRDHGRVVCLASVAGIAGNVGQTNYAASKAGVMGYVRHRASELAPRGITVNAVAPGFIETRLTAAMPPLIRQAGRRLSALGQGGQGRDVAEVITFLASPGASGVSGSVLRVCGGALIGA